MASRLSYDCLCGDVSQSVAFWRDVPMLRMTMQRLVAMRARDLSRYLVTHCSGLPNSCASETKLQASAVAAIAVYSCDVSVRPISCESRVASSNKLCVDASATSTFERPRARASEASVSSGSPSCIDTKGQRRRNSKVRGRAALKGAPGQPRETRRRAASRHVCRRPWLPC